MEEHIAVLEGHDGARVVQLSQLLVAQPGEQEQRPEFVEGHQIVAKQRCTRDTVRIAGFATAPPSSNSPVERIRLALGDAPMRQAVSRSNAGPAGPRVHEAPADLAWSRTRE